MGRASTRPITHSLIKALGRVSGFDIFDERDLLRIVGASANLHWSAGSLVFEKGSPGEVLYIVLSGDVAIYDVVDDKELEIARMGPGDFFGEMSLLRDSTHSKYARAETETELLVLMKDSFRALLRANPELDALVRKRMEERLIAAPDAAG